MGEIENYWLRYLDDPARFACLINGWLMGGRQTYDAADIAPGDRRFDQTGTKDRESIRKAGSRYRDLYKQTDRCGYRLLAGIELSSYRDYLAPVRAMDYDVLAYPKQARQLEQRHIRPYVADYPIHVLDVAHTPDERLLLFSGELAGIFMLIKYQRNKEKLREIIKSIPSLSHISEEGFELLGRQINAPELLERNENNKEEQDMCQAIYEMIEDGKLEGIRIGEARGQIHGEALGRTGMILAILEDLGSIPDKLRERINAEKSIEILKQYTRKAVAAQSIEQFMAEIGM